MAKEPTEKPAAETTADPGAQYNPQKIILLKVLKKIEHVQEDDFDIVLLKYRSARFVRELQSGLRTTTVFAFTVDRDEHAAVAERDAKEEAEREAKEAAARARETLERVEQEAKSLAARRAELAEEAKKLKAQAA